MGVRRAELVCAALALAGCGRIGFGDVSPRDVGVGVDGIALDCLSGPGTPGPSCSGLPSTCGPSHAEPCCSSPAVCGGSFFRGFDAAGDMFVDRSDPATVSTFRLDRFEVTVGRFRQFVNAGLGTQANVPPNGAGARALNGMPDQGGWDPSWNADLPADTAALKTALGGSMCGGSLATWTDVAAGNEALPINCITWFEAMAFCAWDGGFLPTEAESMYAAAGGTLQRAYPWSDPASSATFDCMHANVGGLSGPGSCVGSLNTVGNESPLGDGAWGQADLAGNDWEWVLDWQAPALPTPCVDCANLVPATLRVFRGGGFNVGGDLSRSASRYLDMTDTVTTFRHPALGVRCARAGS